VPDLGQMNANLVRPSCFEPAFDHRVGAPDLLDGSNVRDCALRFNRTTPRSDTPANSIASIAHDPAFDGPRVSQASEHDRPVDAGDFMGRKPSNQFPLGAARERKQHQSTGVAIETMHRPNFHALVAMPLRAGQHPRDDFFENGLAALSLIAPVSFLHPPNRLYSRWLFDHDEIGIGKDDPHIRRCWGDRFRRDIDHIAHLESSGVVKTNSSVDANPPDSNQATCVIPTDVSKKPANNSGEGLAGKGTVDI
jgi:hypothetical protein